MMYNDDITIMYNNADADNNNGTNTTNDNE